MNNASTVLVMEEFKNKKYLEFHNEIKPFCENWGKFEQKFSVDWGHIDKKADVEFIRANLGAEQLAGLILDGDVNTHNCEYVGSKRKIAIEGKITGKDDWVRVIDKEKGIFEEVGIDCVYLRVIVREGNRVHAIITAYDLKPENINKNVSEVKYYVWD